jgi:hypothetical protein
MPYSPSLQPAIRHVEFLLDTGWCAWPAGSAGLSPVQLARLQAGEILTRYDAWRGGFVPVRAVFFQ